MANNKSDVVRYFKRKVDGGYAESPTYFGAKQEFVTALRNSINNNLEEQYLLGTDCLTTTWEDEDGNIRILKEYYIQPNDYEEQPDDNLESYRISSIIYKDSPTIENYIFGEDDFISETDDLSFNNEVNALSFDKEKYGTYSYAEDNSEVSVTSKGFLTSREDTLQWVDASGKIVDVLTKIVSFRIDEAGRQVTKEKIINHLI